MNFFAEKNYLWNLLLTVNSAAIRYITALII